MPLATSTAPNTSQWLIPPEITSANSPVSAPSAPTTDSATLPADIDMRGVSHDRAGNWCPLEHHNFWVVPTTQKL
ncbi:hypothetical protein CS0771_42680 [Catellatospora sp. IY07-71]|nr:hypothetical protein CS0771_42680 [Catellatospora sp. IY07-71]